MITVSEYCIAGALCLGAAKYLHGWATVRASRRFFRENDSAQRPYSEEADLEEETKFIVLLPVLREQTSLPDALAHFSLFSEERGTAIVVITTERELSERPDSPETTIDVANRLRNTCSFTHVHYPGATGRKGDQINYFVEHFEEYFPSVDLGNVFLLIFDADSRPSPGTIACFRTVINAVHNVNVMQQCSRFSYRGYKRGQWLRNAFFDATALRANRFVLLYELPRMLRRAAFYEGRWWHSGGIVYSHVTGHGLAIRGTFLRQFPFPKGAVMEDMFYGFLLNANRIPVYPIGCLDNAEVPCSLKEFFRQAVRWFAGPAQTFMYLPSSGKVKDGLAILTAASGVLIAIQWLAYAFIPGVLILVGLCGKGELQWAVVGFVFSYILTIIPALEFGGARSAVEKSVALLCYPLCITFFGVAGFVGLFNLLFRVSGLEGKTER